MTGFDTPVVFVVFRRPRETKAVFERLRALAPRRLFVAGDGPRGAGDIEAVRETRRVVQRVDWDCDVRFEFADENLGCARRTTSALDAAFARFDRAIVLEDDVLPDPTFFPFCAELLERYADAPRVMAINGFSPLAGRPTGADDLSYTFTPMLGVWGFATWRRTWREIDTSFFATEEARELRRRPLPDLKQLAFLARGAWPEFEADPALRERVGRCGKFRLHWMKLARAQRLADSWAGLFVFHIVARDGLAACPRVNLVRNIGFGAGASLTGSTDTPLAHLEAGSLRFPLRHPASIERDDAAQSRWAVALDAALRHYRFGPGRG